MKKYIGCELHIDPNYGYETKLHDYMNEHFTYETKLKYPYLFLPYDDDGYINLNCDVINNYICYNGRKILNIEQYEAFIVHNKHIEDNKNSKYYGKYFDYYEIMFVKKIMDQVNEFNYKSVGYVDFGNDIKFTNVFVCYSVYYEE